ncbi:MAG: hypothetical protein IK062_03535 [Selenomonadaceae bacterium]|nr:hypothetical protein [Selenomonadaceae bacterium]
MSSDDKSAVLQAMRKMKKANRNVDDIEERGNSGNKRRRNDDDDESIIDSIIDAVSNFKGRD